MRSYLGVVLLAGYAVAVPATNQLVIGQETTAGDLDALVGTFDAHQSHKSIETNETIYTYLSQQEEYTKLVKLIDFDEEFVTILNATTDSVSFFAADNKALTPHKKGHHHHGATLSLATVYEEYEKLQTAEEEDEEKKKRCKKRLRALLKYHTLPTAIPRYGLYVNSTYETALEAHDGSFGGQARRILVVGDLIGRLFVNYYVTVDWKSVNATNGFLYGVSHPLIPPPSILDELFLINRFSILTSALQKVGLDDKLQWRWKSKGEFEGEGPTVSLFAPNDLAFMRLPVRLRLWLFSPAGEKALKKLLSYHIVPDYILNADFVYNATSYDVESMRSAGLFDDCDGEDWYKDIERPTFQPHCSRKERKERQATVESPELASWPSPKVTVNITVPTLLKNHTLHFAVIKPNKHHHVQSDLPFVDATTVPLWRNKAFVNHFATGLEGVARNGAVYGIRRLLNPCKPHSEGVNEDEMWNNWEDYLPAWGEQ